ncbi:uncharacterized protein Z520_00734 [Fonsecaea multimorphosa CBS 102226]|uniref:N-acetyltransferase domain-containing protein n=1 Tax=Fonsecaea multimorphosa CBS 102226 TaxID=1442371 RepID=A0A0D2J3T1_9EURO|nr:uncharacterized protein Z520_00734 [Fonsecaea multimorphosa CBS 102226]KIY04042.1 hypothetical protein Z520_00734 [Fonsecaea multimorphosa CBS 102226]OAL31878.1 hypothetical protein AYO22_00748 [Fonsecaea multimorphosa]
MSEPLSAGIHLVTASTTDISSILDGIVHLHGSCILNDGTMVTFLPPLSHAQMYQWWEERLREVSSGQRHILIHVSKTDDRTATTRAAKGEEDVVVVPASPWESEGRSWPVIHSTTNPEQEQQQQLEISGVVSLSTPFSQTGPFRALVQKLFVSPLHRRRGIARQLMARLEGLAVDLGRWNLMLDTEVGSGAESVYPKLGYERLGVVREYGYSPRDGRLVDEVWFWKDLRKMKRLEEVEVEG